MPAKIQATAATRSRTVDHPAPPSCALDAQGMRRQRERYEALARSVRYLQRDRDVLVVDFAPDLDRQALEQALAVERECCPFFTFSFDARLRRLQAGVSDGSEAGALEAIAALLSPRRRDR